MIQLDGPPCDCGNRGCIEALCLAAVARGDVDEAARVLGAGAANLVGLLDIDLVLLGGRTVAADPEPFVRGVAAVLDERARREGAREVAVPVRVAPGGARGSRRGRRSCCWGRCSDGRTGRCPEECDTRTPVCHISAGGGRSRVRARHSRRGPAGRGARRSGEA